jgi:hypothetical protein
VTDSASNGCGGGNDVFSSTAAKLIAAGENFDTTLNSTVSAAGSYYFHIDVQFGSDSSTASQSFTAVAETPVASPSSSGSSSGGSSGASSAAAPAVVVPQTVATVGVADMNGDGRINSVDFSIMLAFWKTPYPFRNPYVDMNGDKQVNSVDFSILLYQWGKNPALLRRP